MLTKKNQSSDLSVRARFEAALNYYIGEGNAGNITISGLCRIAGINRANLYANYPDLVSSAKSFKPQTRGKEGEGAVLHKNGYDVNKLTNLNRRLLFICLELNLELASVREELRAIQQVRNRRQGRPPSRLV